MRLCAFKVHVSPSFANFSEALFIADSDRRAREQVRQRAPTQQRLAGKGKAPKEENLRGAYWHPRSTKGQQAIRGASSPDAVVK